jgi:hypothetical protein
MTSEARNAESPQVGGWVPVAERLPEEGAIVWFADKGSVFLGFRHGSLWTDVKGFVGGAEYWMPLEKPKAPNADNQNLAR